MKKIISFITLIFISFAIFSVEPKTVHSEDVFRFNPTSTERRFVNGIDHTYQYGEFFTNGVMRRQHLNYLQIRNNGTEDDIRLVSVGGNQANGWGMQGLNVMMEQFEKENPHLEVLGGFNGDFYAINDTGEPTNPQIMNYEVVYRGRLNSNQSHVLAERTDGTVSFEPVVYDGNELLIYNEFNEIKARVKVDTINSPVSDDSKVSIYFDNYTNEINQDLKGFLVEGTDIKPMREEPRTNNNPKLYQFGKGYATLQDHLEIKENSFVVVSSELRDLVSEGDKVVFQAKIVGFEDVRNAVGLYSNSSQGKLVENGQIVTSSSSFSTARAPRTAVGIKEDGSLIILVSDGRQPNVRDGLTLYELAYMMLQLGAQQAFNFDGGGSSTLMLGNSENYEVLNQLSDGRIRSISNGFLLVRGYLGEEPVMVPNPDNRVQFASPNNLYVDLESNLHFNTVPGATSYEVKINDLIIETNKNVVPIVLTAPGNYEITVRAKGTEENKTSNYSESFNYKVNDIEVSKILEMFRNFAKNLG